MTNVTPATIRPEDLATELGLSGKVVRAHLRRTYPRPIEAKGSTWVLSQGVANEVRESFAKKNPQNVTETPAEANAKGGDAS